MVMYLSNVFLNVKIKMDVKLFWSKRKLKEVINCFYGEFFVLEF